MSDPVRSILEFNAGRDLERLALKYRNMRTSPFVFLRATCHLFYENLPDLPDAPPVWCCGDLHLQNFGSYKGDNRLVYFDINDYDESVLAPASWELVRLLTSLQVGAATMELQPAEARTLCDGFLDGYCATLQSGRAGWVERETSEGLIRDLLGSLRNRSRPEFLDSRTRLKNKKRHLRLDNGKALPASDTQREWVIQRMGEVAETRNDPRFYEVLDVARRIAGSGSLGVDRFVILVNGKGSPDGNYLLDLKETLPSSLLPRLTTPQPAWNNEALRAMEIQRRMQAVPMAFLHPLQVGQRAYMLRDLQPAEDRVELGASRSGFEPIAGVVRTMGAIVASAQLRSGGRDGSAIADQLIDFGSGKWRKALLAAADDCADRLNRDWAEYCKAFDDGAFGTR